MAFSLFIQNQQGKSSNVQLAQSSRSNMASSIVETASFGRDMSTICWVPYCLCICLTLLNHLSEIYFPSVTRMPAISEVSLLVWGKGSRYLHSLAPPTANLLHSDCIKQVSQKETKEALLVWRVLMVIPWLVWEGFLVFSSCSCFSQHCKEQPFSVVLRLFLPQLSPVHLC